MGSACGTLSDIAPHNYAVTIKHIPFRTSLDIRVEEIEQ
jgi:hypothetical protein